MGRALDLDGQRFGRLLVLERLGASIPGVQLPEFFLQKNIYILLTIYPIGYIIIL